VRLKRNGVSEKELSPFCCWSRGSGSHRLSPLHLHSQMSQIQTLREERVQTLRP